MGEVIAGQFDNLPVEILTRICAFLDAKFILRTFPLISKRFHEVFTDPQLWKDRLNAKYPGVKLLPRCDSPLDWAQLCAGLESENRLWRAGSTEMSFTNITGGHYGSIDVVHILPKSQLFVTGSRDRDISIWDLKKFPQAAGSASNFRVAVKENAHKGWIWSLSATKDEEILFTGCWDAKIKKWTTGNGGLVEWSAIKCQAPVLCLALEEDCLYAGTFGKKLKMIDVRSDTDICKPLTHHNAPVLSLAVEGNFIFSCGEDKTIAVVDKRTRRPLRIQKFPHYSLALSLGHGMLWAADVGGSIHRLEPMRGSLDLLMSHSVSSFKLSDVKHTDGAVMALSSDGTLKILNPYHPEPKMIAVVGPFSNGVPAKMDYQCDTLVCSFADYSIGVWKPNRN